MAERTLDQIQIASPCNAEWDSMTGNDQIRFCDHCNFKVHNLSAMTRQKALRLVADSRGRLCVRFISGPGGRPLTQMPAKLHNIRRSASLLVARAFTAALTVSSAVAQTRQAGAGRAGNETVQLPQTPLAT